MHVVQASNIGVKSTIPDVCSTR